MTRLLLLFSTFALLAQGAVGVRILLGVGDQTETKWDGEASATGATLSAVEPWRFDRGDAMLPGNAWRISTHRVRRFAGGQAANPAPVVANGVVYIQSNTHLFAFSNGAGKVARPE